MARSTQVWEAGRTRLHYLIAITMGMRIPSITIMIGQNTRPDTSELKVSQSFISSPRGFARPHERTRAAFRRFQYGTRGSAQRARGALEACASTIHLTSLLL
jgi:hypothetical protein